MNGNNVVLTTSLSNTMFGEVDIIGNQVNNFDGRVVVRKDVKKSFNGLVDIPLFNRINTVEGIVRVKQEAKSQFKGKVTIAVENVMYGEVDMLDTPENKQYGVLMQDTYTLSSSPNINYGQDTILQLSNDSTVFLDYSFSPNDFSLFEQENELDSYLQIHINRALQRKAAGEIYIVNEQWFEDALTDSNKPSMSLLSTFEFPLNYVGWIDVSLSDVLKNYDKLTPFNTSLAIKINTDDFTRSHSKKGSYDLSPKIYYRYQYIPPTIRIRKLQGLVNVRLDKQNLFSGRVSVNSEYAESLFKGKVEIPVSENLNSFKGTVFTIQRPIHESFNGMLDVPIFDKDKSFNGKVVVQAIGSSGFPGLIDIPTFYNSDSFGGSLTVRLDRDEKFSGLLNVPIFEQLQTFVGKVKVGLNNQNSFKGIVNTPLFEKVNMVDGKITVRKDLESSFNGLVNVPLFEYRNLLPGKVVIRKDNEEHFKGMLKVQLFNNEERFSGLVGVQEIWKYMFTGTMKVPRYEDTDKFTGEIFIPNTRINMMNGKVYVRSDGGNKAYVYIM